MQRFVIWYVLAFLWGLLGIFGMVRQRGDHGLIALAVALLFLLAGFVVRRRDRTMASRYTGNRPR